MAGKEGQKKMFYCPNQVLIAQEKTGICIANYKQPCDTKFVYGVWQVVQPSWLLLDPPRQTYKCFEQKYSLQSKEPWKVTLKVAK